MSIERERSEPADEAETTGIPTGDVGPGEERPHGGQFTAARRSPSEDAERYDWHRRRHEILFRLDVAQRLYDMGVAVDVTDIAAEAGVKIVGAKEANKTRPK